MIGISLICIPHAGDKRMMAEIFGSGNGSGLCMIVLIGHTRSVGVFQNVVRDRASFRATLRFRFNINICHDETPLLGVKSPDDLSQPKGVKRTILMEISLFRKAADRCPPINVAKP
jgi:hypothetical protein